MLRCLLVGMILVALRSAALAEEPFLRFLDDFDGSPARDPFEERIETERHDFTQSTVTVGKGVLQIESGYTFFYKAHEEEIETSHSLPEMLVRFGVTEDIELRTRFDYIWRFINEADNVDGGEDLQFGLKLGLTEKNCLIPESAVELQMSVPTGGVAWSTDRVNFGVDLIYEWDLTENFRIYGSSGMFQNALGDFGFLPEEPASDRFVVNSQSVALGMDVTRRTTMYLEYYGIFSNDLEDNVSVGFVNAGVDLYISDNLVIDFRAGTGLTEDSDDLFVGVGGGVRF